MKRRKAKKEAAPEAAAIGMVSLGCPKNLVDSEVMLGDLAGNFPVTGDPNQADVVIVNTCSFIEAARQESLDAIRDVATLKEKGQLKGLIVTGCLAQRYGARLKNEVPGIDAIVGMSNYGSLKETVERLARGKSGKGAATTAVDQRCEAPKDEALRLRLTARHNAYLRVSEGCDNPCTFCSIPSFRGSFRSKAPEIVVEEARKLVADGAVELNLISQDLTSYGKDIPGWSLAKLLKDLNDIDGLRWIRLLYAYPAFVTDELIEAIRDLPKVVKYMDMPVQHISQRMLKRMGRLYKGLDHRELLAKIRQMVPGIALRTTFIVGFPGETNEDFEELLSFVNEFKFERLGVFTYSHEEGTPAGNNFLDDIPERIKLERQRRVMEAQREVACAVQQRFVGQTLDVLIDGVDERGVFGRTPYDAPDIDGLVWLEGHGPMPMGSLVKARILKAEGYDLVAEIESSCAIPVATPPEAAHLRPTEPAAVAAV